VYRADGRPVRTLVNSRVNAGDCSVTWDGRDDFGHTVGAGTYLCRICTDAFTSTVKVTKSR
jgi:flagellar hook assembly protein FlgD